MKITDELEMVIKDMEGIMIQQPLKRVSKRILQGNITTLKQIIMKLKR